MKKLISLITICIGLYVSLHADIKTMSPDVYERPINPDLIARRQYQLYRKQIGYLNAWEPYPLYSWDRWYWPARSYYDPGFRSGFWRN